VNVIKEDPKNPQVLYVGTDLGVYVSLNGGIEWQALPGGDLPTSFYHDLAIHPEEDILVAASHGRGVWAMDVRPIQALTEEVMEEPVHLFDLGTVQLPQGFRGGGSSAAIRYWVGTPGAQTRVRITDSSGNLVREMEGTGERGLHTLDWDLTRGGTAPPGGMGMGGMSRVGPGRYTVMVTVGPRSAEGVLTVTQ
jgi:hypothetical protein